MLGFGLKPGSWHSRVKSCLLVYTSLQQFLNWLICWKSFKMNSVFFKAHCLFPEGNGQSSTPFPNTGCKSYTPASQVSGKINALLTCSAVIKGMQLKCAVMDHEIWGEPQATQGEKYVLGGHTVSLMFLWNYHTINWQNKILDFDLLSQSYHFLSWRSFICNLVTYQKV